MPAWVPSLSGWAAVVSGDRTGGIRYRQTWGISWPRYRYAEYSFDTDPQHAKLQLKKPTAPECGAVGQLSESAELGQSLVSALNRFRDLIGCRTTDVVAGFN